jgi:hypothetical protein
MRSRYVASVLAASALVVMTATAAIAAPAPQARAHATTSTNHAARAASLRAVPQAGTGCSGSGSNRYCIVNVQDIWSVSEPYPVIFDRTTGIPELVSGLISITCWYDGSPPSGYANDGVLDHAVVPDVGHIPDDYVNLGGKYPWQSPYSLPHC